MTKTNGMRWLGGSSRSVVAALVALATVAVVPTACANPFETEIDNPNAVLYTSLANPAGATTLVNGLGAAVTRSLTAVYGPYAVATDELTWSGSREFWKNLDDGDISDPVNEYTDGAFPFIAEARWLSDFTIDLVIAFDSAGTLRSPTDYVRAHIFGAITYITIGDMFDDFVINSDREVAGTPIGPNGMTVMFDSAITFLDRALPATQALPAAASRDTLLMRIYGLRARAKFARAAWNKIRPARTVPAQPLVSDAGATADATTALTLMGSGFSYRLAPIANNLAGINIGFEMNNRGEIRPSAQYMGAGPLTTAPIVANDPVTGTLSPTVTSAINACCRGANVGNNIPMTQTSAREMQLILAEERLAAGDSANYLVRINNSRAVDGLPGYPDFTNAVARIQYERRVQLFLQGRRLTDLYRFGVDDPRWLPGSTTATNICFFPISYGERLTNPAAPQPNNQRICQ